MTIFNSAVSISLVLVFGISSVATRLAVAQPAAATQEAVATSVPVRPVHYRKNIDDLSKQELAAFEHAFSRLKEKSQANIYDRTGFIWNAWIHNCPSVEVPDTRSKPLPGDGLKKLLANGTIDSCDPRNFVAFTASEKLHVENPGQCEHRKTIFLQWHRAELYFFEQALRAADPDGTFGPSTKDVTLPYWNFTKKPTGKRYPKAFENPKSPLFDVNRYQKPLPSSLPTASPYLLAYLIYYQDWTTFGGDQLGGVGQGNLETKIHNLMHNDYIGGKMQDNTKAAMDPIFYVFHNFLDYALEKWIEEHGADAIPAGSGRDDYLRAQQDGGLRKPVGFDEGNSDPKQPGWGDYTSNMGRAALYLDTKQQGFAFADKAGELIAKAKIEALIARHQAAGFEFAKGPISLMSALLSYGSGTAVATPDLKLNGTYLIPAQPVSGGTARLRFTRSSSKDYSFRADVYLYPEGTPEEIAKQEFRDRYLVANTAHWGLSYKQAGTDLMLDEDVTAIVNSLVAKQQGQTWNLTVAISGSKEASFNDFSLPAITIQAK